MAQVIGLVKSLENGTFFVKDIEGKEHQLQTGEQIHDGDLVYGDANNAKDAQIVVDETIAGAGTLIIAGNDALYFDTSVLAKAFDADDSTIHINSLNEALAIIASSETVPLEDANAGDILKTDTDETNAGETAAGNTVTDTERSGDIFADRTGAVGDVSTAVGATDTNISTTSVTDTTNPIILNANTPIAGANTLISAPTISINDVTVNEDAGTMTFTVSLSQATTAPVTFSYASANNAPLSAAAGSDYTAVSGTGSIATGDTTATITVPISDDFLKEGNETFVMNLSNLSSNVASSGNDLQGVGTITDEAVRGAEDTVTLKVIAVDASGAIIGDGTTNSGAESGNTYYKVIAVDPSGTQISATGTATVAFTAGTATTADYTPSATTVNIGQVFNAALVNDTLDENNESFTVGLVPNSISGMGIYENVVTSTSIVTSTIIDNDLPPVVSNVLSDDDNVNENTDTNLTNNIVQTGTIQNIGTSDVITLSGSTSITSNNKAVTYAWDAISKTLIASSSEGEVFTITVNANNTGYTFTQLKAIDHLITVQGEAELKTLDFKLDVEGGISPSSFTVSIYDDAPTVSGTLSISTDNDGSFTQTGVLTQVVLSNDITSVVWNTGALPTNLVYQGKTISYVDLGNGVLEGRTVSTDSSTAIFRAKIDPSVVNDSGNPTYTFELLQSLNTNGQIGFIDSDTAYTIIGGGNVNEKNIQFGGYLIQNMTGYQADHTVSQVNTNQNWVGVGSGGGPGNWFESGEYLVMKFYEPDNSRAEVRNLGVLVEGNGSAAYSLKWTVTVAIDAAGNTTQYSGTFNGIGNDDVSFNIPLMNGALYFTEAKIENTSGNFRINFSGAVANNYFEDIALPLSYTLVDADGDRTSGSIDVTLNAPSRLEITGIGVTSGDETVYESNLSDGTALDTASLTQTGNFNITATEGITSLMIGSTSLTLAQVQSLGTTSVQIDTTYGLLTLNGYSGNTKGGLVSYSYLLQDNVDNDTVGTSAGYVESLNVKLTDTTGVNSTTTLNFNIVDDTPTVKPFNATFEPTAINTNLMVMLDLSGSMNWEVANNTSPEAGELSRLQMAKQALSNLVDKYDALGDVKVMLVTFNETAQVQTNYWMSVSELKTVVNLLTADGSTNYDYALAKAMEGFAISTGKLTGTNVQNISYFLSDGAPTRGLDKLNSGGYDLDLRGVITGNGTLNDDIGIQTSEEAIWSDFLINNKILSHAIGSVVTGMDPIAYNGITGANTNATVITDLSQLDSTLAATVPMKPLTGNLSGGLLNGFGADGGYVKSFTVDGTTYTYNPSGTGSITPIGGVASFDTTSNTLTVITAHGSTVTVNMDTGDASFTAPSLVQTGFVENFAYSLVDNDGDVVSSNATINVPVSIIGSDANDTLNGTSNAELLLGGSGDDTLSGLGGSDILKGGDGNDTLIFDAADTLIDGGTGMDTLILATNADIDFSTLGNVIKNIEVIDLTQNGSHRLDKLTVNDVLDMTDPSTHDLIILGGVDDTVNLQDTATGKWTNTGQVDTTTIAGHTLDIYTNSADNTVHVKIENTVMDTIVH